MVNNKDDTADITAPIIRPNPDPSTITTNAIDRSVSNLDEKLSLRIQSIEKSIDVTHADYVRVPTIVTQEISHLKSLLEEKISRVKDIDAGHFDRIIILMAEAEKRTSARFIEGDKQYTEKYEKLASISDERFEGITNQFIERDKRTDQLTVASATAVQAAFAAQKEAVSEQNKSNSLAIAKSEASTAEALRQLQTLFQSDSRAMKEQIADLKSRLDRGEGSQAILDPAISNQLSDLSGEIRALKSSSLINQGSLAGMREQRTDDRLSFGQLIAVISVSFVGLSVIASIVGFIFTHVVK